MGFDHRKLLTMAQTSLNSVSRFCMLNCNTDKHGGCPDPCPPKCSEKCVNPPPLPPPPPPPVRRIPHSGLDSSQKHFVTGSMTAMACMGLLFGIICVAIRVYFIRRNNSRRRNHPPIIFGTQDDFLDWNQGPATVDHPIWYINTVGLPQSVIDSITVFKYKRDEGLIEGTECSVCLSEFEEDENLRLLPKCSHAFHIPCIDTWLRSHKNCPLCRAPVICSAFAAQASELGPSLNDSGSRNDNAVEDHGGEETIHVVEGGTSEVRNGHDDGGASHIEDMYTAENSKKTRNCDSDSRVLSDLAGNRRVVEEEMQPMRRSVSLDSSSAATIYKDVANTQSSLKSNTSKSKTVAKPSGVSSSISKLMKSSSIGCSLQKGPNSMKRSFSFSGKRSSSRHSRRHSVLPL